MATTASPAPRPSGLRKRPFVRSFLRWTARAILAFLAVSVGMTCERVGGIGYAEDPDWQPGAAFVTVWPDGRFNVELLRWDAGELVWRDQRFPGGE